MKSRSFVIILVLTIAASVRFYNLMWGNGFYFHPDENNMARAISLLNPGNNFRPDFFAYGQLPLYLAYFSAVISNAIHNVMTNVKVDIFRVQFQDAIFWLRFYSAVSGVGIVFLTYKISRLIVPVTYSIIAAILISFTSGLIQFSHFGTTESVLTALFLSIILISIKISLSKPKKRVSKSLFALLGGAFGLSLGIKLSSIYFVFPILASYVLYLRSYSSKKLTIYVVPTLLLCTSTIFGYIISSPYNIVNYGEFLKSMSYETSVANGLEVFYTRQFLDTVPFIFQVQKIFPYALGWPLYVFGVMSVVYALYYCFNAIIQRKTANNTIFIVLLLLLISFFGYIVPTSTLFIKWTRFMTPVFPLIIIFASYGLYVFIKALKHNQLFRVKKYLLYAIIFVFIVLSITPGVLFMNVYTQDDIRTTASEWIYENIEPSSYILSETGNVVDIPVPIEGASLGYTVISFNFYNLDHPVEGPVLYEKLTTHLERADYILVPSRRIFVNHMRFPDRFPSVNSYYKALFNGQLGFELVKTIKPAVNDEIAEETWSVFDHPVIRVYKKTTAKTALEYDMILSS